MKSLREWIEGEIARCENADIRTSDQSDNSPMVYNSGIIRGLRMALEEFKSRENAECEAFDGEKTVTPDNGYEKEKPQPGAVVASEQG